MKASLDYIFQDRTESLKSTLVDAVVNIHDAHSEGQLIMEERGRRGYGHSIWAALPKSLSKAVTYTFADASVMSPPKRPYSLPILNGCVFFPWRIPGGESIPAATDYPQGLQELFGQSQVKQESLFGDDEDIEDGQLDLLVPETSNMLKIVFIAVEATPERLDKITWGEVARGTTADSVVWLSKEVLHSAEVGSGSIGQQAFGTFTAGPIPPSIAAPRTEGTTDRE
ncbi:hypothetical protein [Enteractinococcus helveticum]|uniref:Uncharacterized protein n=1 Tax=Enteractinococcus helveticum TaxID=1837282 RepID=A0A1B7M2S8_9MICC|nr:hypothetical protein [Enteractinococcus helveticum]OAV62891.1 hypothetical protein A6F49_04335 [Enteractinococcus helveticum]